MHNGAIMPSEVCHLVDRGQSYPLVRLTGVLDCDTAAPVRSTLLDVLARDVGIRGIFTDWAATVTYYANCMGLK